jgi:hypothetical protein
MNTHILTRRGPLPVAGRPALRPSRPTVNAVRAWLNEPARHEPVPTTAIMYGLPRPNDRRDIGGSR